MKVSLKQMAEGKTEGVQKTTQFKVNPRLLEVEDGFNARPIDREHVEAMKTSYKAGATFPALVVRVDAGRIIIVEGHHRSVVYNELMDEGLEILGVDAIQFRGNDADRVALMLTSAQGLALTPLQAGVQYRRLQGFGWTVAQIAAKCGKSNVSEMILLAESNSDVLRMVTAKEVSATVAVKMVKKHGEKAGAVMADIASKSGRVTEKTVNGMSLEKAIQLEIDTVGMIRAEVSCPKHKGLIEYMRSA